MQTREPNQSSPTLHPTTRVESRSRSRTWLGILAGIMLLGVGIGIYATTEVSVEHSADVFSGVGVIELDVDNGSVSIVGTDTDQVTAQREISVGSIAGEARYEHSDETLRIVHDCPLLIGWSCHSSFELTVPENTVVNGRAGKGGIEIVNLDGQVRIQTDNGTVHLRDLTQQVVAETRKGNIIATGLSSVDLDFRTNSGRVELEFADVPRSVVVDTGNGAIELVLPSDSPALAIDATTTRGTIATDIRTDPTAANRVELRSSNGSIGVRYATD